MEALFSYIVFEELDEKQETVDDGDPKPRKGLDARPESTYQPIINLVKSASSLALSALLPKKQFSKRRFVANTVSAVAGYWYHSVSSLASGVKQLATTGTARPSWDYRTHMTMHWLRNVLLLDHGTIYGVRSGERAVGPIISLVTGGVTITECSVQCDREQLFSYEKKGRPFQQQTQAWR